MRISGILREIITTLEDLKEFGLPILIIVIVCCIISGPILWGTAIIVSLESSLGE